MTIDLTPAEANAIMVSLSFAKQAVEIDDDETPKKIQRGTLALIERVARKIDAARKAEEAAGEPG